MGALTGHQEAGTARPPRLRYPPDQPRLRGEFMRDGQLEIVPATMPMRLVDEDDGLAAVADADMPVLTADMVRDTLERDRR